MNGLFTEIASSAAAGAIFAVSVIGIVTAIQRRMTATKTKGPPVFAPKPQLYHAVYDLTNRRLLKIEGAKHVEATTISASETAGRGFIARFTAEAFGVVSAITLSNQLGEAIADEWFGPSTTPKTEAPKGTP